MRQVRAPFSWSFTQTINASEICLQLLCEAERVALALALARAGRSNPARIAMIAMTTSSSMRVNPRRRDFSKMFMLLLVDVTDYGNEQGCQCLLLFPCGFRAALPG